MKEEESENVDAASPAKAIIMEENRAPARQQIAPSPTDAVVDSKSEERRAEKPPPPPKSLIKSEDDAETQLVKAELAEEMRRLAANAAALHADPGFAQLCSFFNTFGALLNMKPVTFAKLERMLVESHHDAAAGADGGDGACFL